MCLTERADGLSVASLLSARATTDPEARFLISRGRAVTYGEADSRAEALAAALHDLGVKAGDRIALVLPACPEFVITMFGAAKLGATIVPLNPRLALLELQYMLRHSEATCAVVIEEHHGVSYLELFEDLLAELPELHYLVTVGDAESWYDDQVFQFEDLVSAGAGRDFPAPGLAAEADVFAILYTSGTTGKPKGVALTHRNLVYAAASTVRAIGLGRDDRVVGVTAFFHVFGIGPGLLGSVLAGASMVLQDEFDAGATLDLIERHGVTVQFGIPQLFAAQLHEQDRRSRDLSSLRLGVAAGAPVSDELLRDAQRSLCPTLLVAYSLTEASSMVSVTRPDDPGGKRSHTVGRPLGGTAVRVLESDGTELPLESVGEVAVRGPGVMKGYYRQPGQTAASFDAEGFLLTGDLGIVDEEGYVHLVGRRKEVIIRSGFNVYPRELEDRLRAHPAVCQSAVVGVPDPALGEAICACIVPVEGAIVTGREIMEWCRVTLADYKIPDLVSFRDDLPMTDTGKLRRAELARTVRAERQS